MIHVIRATFRAFAVRTSMLVLLLAPLGSASSEGHRLDTSIRLFESWIEGKMAYQGLPGVSVGVVEGDTLVWSKGFGYSNVGERTATTPATLYRIGSITKLFTATAILQLVEQGKLQLDDPVTRHLPRFHMRNPYPDAPPITIRHLLTHSSGLPAEGPFDYWTDARFPTFAELCKALEQEEVAFPPETHLKYSNLGYALLGQIVATISGEPFEQYVQRAILKPLGMSATSAAAGPDVRARLAVGYGRRMPDGSRAVRAFEDMNGLGAAGNMSSTVADLARFVSAIFRTDSASGPHVLREATWKRMQQPQRMRADWQSGFGLGFAVQNTAGHVYVGHEGWVGGFHDP